MYELCLKLIKASKAYADDTDKATMNDERWYGIASKCRGMSVEDSLQRFDEMRTGSPEMVYPGSNLDRRCEQSSPGSSLVSM